MRNLVPKGISYDSDDDDYKIAIHNKEVLKIYGEMTVNELMTKKIGTEVAVNQKLIVNQGDTKAVIKEDALKLEAHSEEDDPFHIHS
ncbi:hypothetical protein PEBR_33685 [Penicillium brasilianum]|uniref:Uncharacterized protein n=1 Tax=Penicillium brasilianum TaxID=104259 RepID=A0A1S9RFC7_PENBI|nr:hypothetical protein PEBR_33685 [Penicillium brasilianum]